MPEKPDSRFRSEPCVDQEIGKAWEKIEHIKRRLKQKNQEQPEPDNVKTAVLR